MSSGCAGETPARDSNDRRGQLTEHAAWALSSAPNFGRPRCLRQSLPQRRMSPAALVAAEDGTTSASPCRSLRRGLARDAIAPRPMEPRPDRHTAVVRMVPAPRLFSVEIRHPEPLVIVLVPHANASGPSEPRRALVASARYARSFKGPETGERGSC